MTGPTGDQPHGYWDIVEVDAPSRLDVRRRLRPRGRDADTDFPTDDGRVTHRADRRRPDADVHRDRFPTAEAIEQVLAMGMKEGLTEAVGQIDAILAEDLATTGDER